MIPNSPTGPTSCASDAAKPARSLPRYQRAPAAPGYLPAAANTQTPQANRTVGPPAFPSLRSLCPGSAQLPGQG